jgi:cytochrome b561
MHALLCAALLAGGSGPLPAPVQLALAEPQPSTPADDFDLLPKEKAPDPVLQKELQRQLALRRQMLQLHQLGGFVTLGAMGATVALGQANYSDKYGGGGDTRKYMVWHRWFGIGTAVVFAATGALAVFAPSPPPKPVRLDTATVHKISLAIASVGMLTQIILGPIIASKEGQLSQRDFALAHQIVGYTTLVATATGAVALTF